MQAVGYGGPLMEAAGCRLHADLTALAVMGFLPVLSMLHKFRRLIGRADAYFRRQRPDAVVLIDFPGFNWWIARRAKAQGITVFYYVPPQIWAWAQWRVKKMRRLAGHVLCTLPFEEKWLREQGCNATFIGHPFFDEVRRQELDPAFLEEYRQRAGPLVTILPGSRTQEVKMNLKRSCGRPRDPPPPTPDAFCDRFVQGIPGGAGAAGRGRKRPGNRGLRRPHAGVDPACRSLHGGIRVGIAGAALPDQTDGDPLPRQPLELLPPERVPQGEIHHAGQPAGGRRAVSPRPQALRSPAEGRRPGAVSRVRDLQGPLAADCGPSDRLVDRRESPATAGRGLGGASGEGRPCRRSSRAADYILKTLVS